jgi:hypothetical protein
MMFFCQSATDVRRRAVKRWRKSFRDFADRLRLVNPADVGPQDQSSPPDGSEAPSRARTTAEMRSRVSMGAALRVMGLIQVRFVERAL